ncbi:glycosyltransferase family 9 protein [Vampirovibrio sp.]|uniref:glycosyltransferase family 9 protein n=1 Tax=Vampirovibrio sp. TaxID=2717857 RepID=UPI00359479E7
MPESSHPQHPQNILVIPLRYIGDTILTVPLIRNLKHHFPNANIDVLCSQTAAPLLETCPYIRKVLIEPKGTPARLQQLRQGNYQQVYSLRKSVTVALMCKLAGVPQVIGYDKQRFPFGYKRWGWFLDTQSHYPGLKTDIPQPISHLGLLQATGLAPVDNHLELWATQSDQKAIEALLSQHGVDTTQPIAVLHAASASHGKQIDWDKFSASLHHLHQAGYQLLNTGTKADQALYHQLAQSTGLPLVNLAGKTTLRETVALYQRIQLLLTVDSSPIHLGAAAGVPHIVGVFGPTNQKQWGPHHAGIQFRPVFVDLPCRPCYAKVCEHNNCKVQLTGAQIAESVKALSLHSTLLEQENR